MFGESLGSQVSEEMFVGTGVTGPSGIGLDAAVWIGTPAAHQVVARAVGRSNGCGCS